MLRKTPGFTAVAVLTLALGIGANTAIFSVINAVLLKPLSYRNPGRLMVIWTDNPTLNLGIHELPPSQLDLLDWRRRAPSFEQLAGIESTSVDLNRNGETIRIGAVEVTASFFPTMGMPPTLGRGFTAEEEQPGKDKIVVISDGLWQREFGGDPNLVGKSLTLNNEKRVVVGIMPPGFNFPRNAADARTLRSACAVRPLVAYGPRCRLLAGRRQSAVDRDRALEAERHPAAGAE